MKRLRSWIIGGILLILPFLFEPGLAEELRVPKIKGIIFFGGIFGAYYIYKNIKQTLGISFCLVAASAVLTGLGPTAQLEYLAIIASAIVISSFTVNLSEREITRILGYLVIAGVGSAFMGYLQMLDCDPLFTLFQNAPRHMPTGFLGQQTLFGPFIASCIIAALFRKYYLAAIFMLVPCLVTQSTFTLAGLCAGVVIWLFSAVSEALAITFIFTGVVSVIGFYLKNPTHHFFDPSGRYDNWGWIWNAAISKPYFGHGIGTFSAYASFLQPAIMVKDYGLYQQAHCDYLEIFFELGLAGLIALGLVLYDYVEYSIKYIYIRPVAAMSAICAVYLVNALGNFPFRVSPQGLIALIAWVIVVTFQEKEFT